MKKAFLSVGALVATFAAFAASTITYDKDGSGGWNDTTRWVGGVVPVAGDNIVIPDGAEAEVADADKTLFDSVKGSGVIDIQEGGKLVLKVATTPSSKWNGLKGGGTIVIDYSGAQVNITQCIGTFDGSWDIKSGIISVCDAGDRQNGLFGKYYSSGYAPGSVTVRDGAHILLPAYSNFTQQKFGYRNFRLAGHGSDGCGAIRTGWNVSQPYVLSCVTLDADSSIATQGSDGTHPLLGIIGNNPDQKGYLDLNGHDLYLTKMSERPGVFRFKNILVTNSVPASGGNIYVEGIYSASMHELRVDSDVVFDKNVKIRTSKYGRVVYNCADGETPGPIAATLVPGSSVKDISLGTADDGVARSFEYSGAVEIASGKTFGVEAVNGDNTLEVSGAVSGAGTISASGGTLVLSGDNSAFTGAISADGTASGGAIVKIPSPASLPASADVTVKSATLSVEIENFTFSQYLALVNGVNYADACGSVTIDPSGCADGTYTLELGNGDIADYEKSAVGVSGEGTVKVGTLPTEGKVRFAAWQGTLLFADGVFPVNDIVVNAKSGSVEITNSLVTGDCVLPAADTEGIVVGLGSGVGWMEIVDSTVTNHLVVGYGKGSVGTFIAKDSSMFLIGEAAGKLSAANLTAVNFGGKGHSYAEFDNCQITINGYPYFSHFGAASVCVQRGGTLNVNNYLGSGTAGVYLGAHRGSDNANHSEAHYLLTDGGRAEHTQELYVASEGNDGAYDHYTYAVLTVSGAGSKFTTANQTSIGDSPQATGIINVRDGGTYSGKNLLGGYSNNHGESFFNFCGGTYEYKGWGEPMLFGETGGTTQKTAPLTRVTVFGEGGELLCSSSDTGKSLGQPITAPSGKGVKEIAWTDTETEFETCPSVRIEGDGKGASAIVNWDSATRKVTGITVTSPGNDYQTAQACLRIGSNTNLLYLACTLEENDTSGGMTFRHTGGGRITFDQANTYRGETVFWSSRTDGRFKVTNANAFRTSAAIKLQSGKLELAEDVTIAALGVPMKFQGGQVSGSADGWNVIPEGRMVIDLKDVVAGEQYTVANNANLVLPSSIPLLNGDSAALDENVKYMILMLPKNYSGTLPVFTGLPENWHVSRTATGFRLSHDRGGMLIIR